MVKRCPVSDCYFELHCIYVTVPYNLYAVVMRVIVWFASCYNIIHKLHVTIIAEMCSVVIRTGWHIVMQL